jgi:predicted transcriptional regulator
MADPRRISVCFSLRNKCDLFGLPMNKKYRSHFEVIASILESTQYAGATSTSIMKLVNTNHKQITRYLEFLVKSGFIKVGLEKNKVLYRSGEKGFEFMRHYYALQEMLTPDVSIKLHDPMEKNGFDLSRKGQRSEMLYESTAANL